MRQFLIITLFFTIFAGCKDVRKEYYLSGELYSEHEFKDEVKHGKVYTYHKNGQIEMEGRYENDKREGVFKWYYSNGKVESIVMFKNGKEDGKYVEYYESGAIKAEAHFKDGKQHGLIKKYYEDGTIKSKQSWVDDLEHGEHKFYFPSGQLKKIAFLDNGQTVYYKKYNEQGRVADVFREVEIGQLFEMDTLYVGNKYEVFGNAKGPSDIITVGFHFTSQDKTTGKWVQDTGFAFSNEHPNFYTPRSTGKKEMRVAIMDTDSTFYWVLSRDLTVLPRKPI